MNSLRRYEILVPLLFNDGSPVLSHSGRLTLCTVSRITTSRPGPPRFGELPHCSHDAVVNLQFVGLAQAHDKDAVVCFMTVLREPLVCGDEETALAHQSRPEEHRRPCLGRACHEYPGLRAPEPEVRGRCGSEYSRPRKSSFVASRLKGRDLFFGQGRSIIEASEDVFALHRRIGAEQIFDRIAIRQHAKDLMHRDAGALDTGLAVTNLRVD